MLSIDAKRCLTRDPKISLGSPPVPAPEKWGPPVFVIGGEQVSSIESEVTDGTVRCRDGKPRGM
jgi:hypothetical protein